MLSTQAVRASLAGWAAVILALNAPGIPFADFGVFMACGFPFRGRFDPW
jgi:hypothetical protein